MIRVVLPGARPVQEELTRSSRGSHEEWTEVYDVELAEWRVVSHTLYPLHKSAQPSIGPESRKDRVHPVPLAGEEGPHSAAEAV